MTGGEAEVGKVRADMGITWRVGSRMKTWGGGPGAGGLRRGPRQVPTQGLSWRCLRGSEKAGLWGKQVGRQELKGKGRHRQGQLIKGTGTVGGTWHLIL